MGVRFQVALVGDEDARLEALALEALAEVDRLEALFDNWDRDSAVSRLNATPGTGFVDAPQELAELLAGAQRLRERTGGAYDVTVAPALRAFGFDEGPAAGGPDAPGAAGPRSPGDAELRALRERIGGDKLEVGLEPPRVRRAVEGMVLDVSSAAKGFAVERVVALLRARGVENAFVAAGGSSVHGLGPGPEGEGWPFEIAPGETWRLIDESVSTSGDSWRDLQLGERRLSHIFDPRTGKPAERRVELACFRGPSAFEADMASTALVVLGAEGATRWFDEDPALRGRGAWIRCGDEAPLRFGTARSTGP
jgi:thiamine biosynthesis lipoprotein